MPMQSFIHVKSILREKSGSSHCSTPSCDHFELRPFWSPWRVEKTFDDQNSGKSRVMVTIKQLKVVKRRLFEKVSLERYIEKFPLLVLPRNTVMSQHLITQFLVYRLSSVSLQKVKNKRQFPTFSSKSVHGCLQVVAYKRFQIK